MSMAMLVRVAESPASTTDPVSQWLVALILVGIFALLTLEAAHRVLVMAGSVALIWLITYLTPWKLLSFEGSAQALDLNVLLLLAGMMALVGVLKTTGIFPHLVARLLQASGGRPQVIQRLFFWATGGLSAMLDNVTTVIFMTPMASDAARHLQVPAAVFLLPLVMAANIGGTATLIGDPPNVMIGSGADLSFLAFLENLTVPVLVMMVVIGAYARRYFRDQVPTEPRSVAVPVPPLSDPGLLRWALGILAVVFIGFLTHGFTGMPVAVPAMVGAAALLVIQDVRYLRHTRPTPAERAHGMLDILEGEIEWPTISFFALLFIVVGAAVATGLIASLANGLIAVIQFLRAAGGLSDSVTVLVAALMICWASGILSAFIDNIPYVAVSIPLVAQLNAQLTGDTSVLWWALALGACLGGNGTIVGASANVTTIGLAERLGVRIGFAEFGRFGGRVMIITLLIASLFLTGMVLLGHFWTTLLGGVLLLVLLAMDRHAQRTVGAAQP